jgi:hypothetical protein
LNAATWAGKINIHSILESFPHFRSISWLDQPTQTTCFTGSGNQASYSTRRSIELTLCSMGGLDPPIQISGKAGSAGQASRWSNFGFDLN